MDLEIHFKDTFRAFSKDEDGKQYKNPLKSVIVSRDFNGQKVINLMCDSLLNSKYIKF
jgi:hypothetical protein